MLLKKLFAITILILLSTSHGQPLDTLPHVNSNISDTQLRQFLQHSAEWLTMKSTELGDEALQHYVEQLHHVLHPACLRCTDYFQAVAVVRGMGKAIRKLLQQDTNDNFYPAIRRSFVAAVWLLQRSKMFVWNSSHLDSSMLGTMLRCARRRAAKTTSACSEWLITYGWRRADGSHHLTTGQTGPSVQLPTLAAHTEVMRHTKTVAVCHAIAGLHWLQKQKQKQHGLHTAERFSHAC